MGDALQEGKNLERRKREMKERMAKEMTYLGAGVGLVLFAIFGLLPGSFIGGVVGLSIAGTVLGMPVEAGIIARVIVAGSMVLGVMVSGLIVVTATSTVGWLIGTAIDAVRGGGRADIVTVKAR